MFRFSLDDTRGDIADFSVAKTFENEAILADLLNQQQKFKEAEVVATKVLTICEEVYGSKHEITCLTAMILSWSYHHQGRLGEALTTIKKASEGYMRTHGPDHATSKECERRIIEITREIDHLRKPRNGDFPSTNSPLQVPGVFSGLGNSGPDLLSKDLTGTFSTF
jgi:hypothetical protein